MSLKHSRQASPAGSQESKRPRTDDDDMDKAVLSDDFISSIPAPPSKLALLHATILLLCIVLHSAGQVKSMYGDLGNARELIRMDESVLQALDRCWKEKKFAEVRNLPQLREPVPASYPPALPSVPHKQSQDATEKSWVAPYAGWAHDILWCQIKEVQARSLTNSYSHVLPITQSSGTGKSRMIDELSKGRFLIPMVLRTSDGYPPPDVSLREWLTSPLSAAESTKRFTAFLMALFGHTASVVEHIDKHIASMSSEEPPMTIAAKFRQLMTHDQSYSSPGDFRKSFYEEVVRIGKELEVDVKISHGNGSPRYKHKEGDLDDYVEKLTGRIQTKEVVDGPAFILSFDEAHSLTPIRHDHGNGMPWSHFFELGRVLRALSKVRVISLFLSTSGDIRQFTPPLEHAPSLRIQQGSLLQNKPYTALGFDQIAKPIKRGELSIDDVSSNERIVYLGRPLFGSRYSSGSAAVKKEIVGFAREKLVGSMNQLTAVQQLACLAVRIPVQFDPISSIGSTTAASLVKNHMRLCLDVNVQSSDMTSVSPSEPLLAEAARSAMMDSNFKFHAAKVLETHLSSSGLDKGNRGELIAMLLLTLAYDAAAWQ